MKGRRSDIFIGPGVNPGKKGAGPLGIPLGMTQVVRRACNKSKGCGIIDLKSPKSRYGRDLIVESKGVPDDRESEACLAVRQGSRRQTFVMTYRNRI